MGHFLAALLGKLCADEVRTWLPWISERMIRLAVKRLPEDQRERYSEEWHSHLDEVPGEIGRLLTACGFVFAVKRVSRPNRILEVLWSTAMLVALSPLFGLVYLMVRISGSGTPDERRRIKI